jgi:hypothetical protein
VTRTTVDLDPEVRVILQEHVDESGISAKAVDDAVRPSTAAHPAANSTFRTPAFSMGVPTVNLDHALVLAADLEDDELIRKMRMGE